MSDKDKIKELTAAILDPIPYFGTNEGAPDILRWWAHRLVHVMGEDPRGGQIKALHEIANRMDDAVGVK